MPLRKLIGKLTRPIEALDHEKLRLFCERFPEATSIADVEPRVDATVVGEITSLQIVPRPSGSPWLEATISDGTGYLVARWTGRRRIAGIKPGQRLKVSGRSSPTGPGGRPLVYNPEYELL